MFEKFVWKKLAEFFFSYEKRMLDFVYENILKYLRIFDMHDKRVEKCLRNLLCILGLSGILFDGKLIFLHEICFCMKIFFK